MSATFPIKHQIRRLSMPCDVRFAMVHGLSRPFKPTVFSSLTGLCRRIHKQRQGAALDLQDSTLHLYEDMPAGRRAVSVYTLDEAGTRQRFLGWAWIDGGDWRALRAALFALEPDNQVRAEAA